MKEQQQLWLGRNARLPGVLAHAVLHAVGGSSGKNWQEQTKCASLEESLRAIAALARQEGPLGGPARLLEVVFDMGWVFAALGGAGDWIFILMSQEAAEDEVAAVRRLCQDFLSLAGADHYE